MEVLASSVNCLRLAKRAVLSKLGAPWARLWFVLLATPFVSSPFLLVLGFSLGFSDLFGLFESRVSPLGARETGWLWGCSIGLFYLLLRLAKRAVLNDLGATLECAGRLAAYLVLFSRRRGRLWAAGMEIGCKKVDAVVDAKRPEDMRAEGRCSETAGDHWVLDMVVPVG
ncbi:hypothetical protein U1Q18_008422 [Sarracenia purpurea var. burkii]